MLKTFSTLISLFFGLATFFPYYLNIWKGAVKPHIFSWLIWCVLTGLGFTLSFSNGGGAGSYIFALNSVLCFFVVLMSFSRGEKRITKTDWLAFLSALVVIIIYIFTKDALLSIILAVTIDTLGYIPTFRKSYSKPHEESALTFFFALLSDAFAIAALQNYSIITLLYPTVLIIINFLLISFLMLRRRS